MLDPRFKNVDFARDWRDSWIEGFTRIVEQEAPCAVEVPHEEEEEEEFTLRPSTSELSRYLEERAGAVVDPLQWWGANAVGYPNLAKLARKYLCVTATSAPSERLFSRTGNVITKKRTKLDDDVLEAAMLVGDVVKRGAKRKRSGNNTTPPAKRQKRD